MRGGVATVDAVVSLTGFSLVGGPAYNDAAGAQALLGELDVPYLAAHALEHDLRRDLALAEARDLQVAAEVGGGAVEGAVDRAGLDLHLHAHA